MTDHALKLMQEKLARRVDQTTPKAGQLREGESFDPDTGEIFQRPRLNWLEPVRTNKNGAGHQLAAGTDYVVRKTMTQDKPMYWAWHEKKLLGYSTDVEIARTHCEAHHMGATKDGLCPSSAV